MNSPRAGEYLTHQWRSRERSSVRRSLPLPGIACHRLVPAGLLPADARTAVRLAFSDFSVLDLKAGDRIRTGDVQLGKLTFYH